MAADHTGGVEVHFFETPAEWRAWLEAHHGSETEVFVGFRRKASGLPTMTWSEAVDEALCFGWIDGVRRGVDGTSYCNRFTPRRRGSTWSRVNVGKVEALTAQGKMRPPGIAAFEARERVGVYSHEAPQALSPVYEARLRADAAAWEDWSSRAPSYRRQAAHWVASAKREATRERRLAQLIEASGEGRKVGPLSR
jgi:uncharacterized protein YdeI (YjbR/CyaY-like superfamily)